MENKGKFKQKLEFSKSRSYYKRCLFLQTQTADPTSLKDKQNMSLVLKPKEKTQMIFAEALEETIKSEKTLTENGAVGYKTTKSSLLDFNFKASSFRNKSESEIENAFADAYNENPLLAVKLMFMTGDIRQGMGERRTFATCLKWLAKHRKDAAEKIIGLVPEYSRWDILVDMLGTEVDAKTFELIQSQLVIDTDNCLKGKPISLLAKWLPSVHTSSKETRRKARSLCARLGMTERQYRKRLSLLRSHSNVVEVKMSSNNWDKIAYEAVPSKANLIYRDAFMRHDEARRTEYLDALEKGTAKINSTALFPYEIVSRYYGRNMPIDSTVEQLWKALPDYANGKGENTLCVIDGSGSMSSGVGETNVTCRDVAISLGIYFSEKMPGQFHDKYITFSENPKLLDLGNCNTLNEKVREALRHHECENTNIEKVFRLILDTAKSHRLRQDEMPKGVLIVSDMEFDGAVSLGSFSSGDPWNRPSGDQFDGMCRTLFETIGDEYRQAGYELPKLVFWNVCSRTGAVPLQQNKNGVILVSGFSPTIASMVLSQKNDPYDVLLEKLNSKRYDAVEKALA